MQRRKYLGTILAGTVSVLALTSIAQAQDTTESVVVTGTRIRGTDTPTPVQVQTAENLQSITPASISEALVKSPIFMGGSTPNNAVTGANGRGGNLPGYYLNLRNLGTIRTLVLLDGHRVPGTNYDTTVDSQALPQLLVQRVEVVTGGASAVYGSDAVTGVVNYILDRKFDGLKGVLQGAPPAMATRAVCASVSRAAMTCWAAISSGARNIAAATPFPTPPPARWATRAIR